jgi:two-component system, sensor histidine kinase YesM
MKQLSLRQRLLILMIILTVLPVVTVTWIATVNTRQSVEKELIAANESRMMWADQYLDELIEQIDTLFYTLQIDEQLIIRLGTELDEADLGVQLSTHQAMRDTLTAAFFAHSRKIDKLMLYSEASSRAISVSYSDSGTISALRLEDGPWSRIRLEPTSMYFKQTADGIYAFHSINRFPDKALLGGIAVRINEDVWEEVGTILNSEPESAVFLINDEGELLSGSTPHTAPEEMLNQLKAAELPDLGIVRRETEQYLYFMERIGGGRLTVVKAVPKATIDASALPTIRAAIMTGSLFAAASMLLAILFSLRISRPIVSLARTMRTTQLSQIQQGEPTSVQSFDEIGLLQHGYNLMIGRIKELIEHEYQREIDVKNAQLLALQAQINPHFLNNTLHMIGGMALAKDAPEIYRITRVIGDLLRYSISTGDELVTLQDELAHIRNYLYIQEQRFAGRCTMTVHAEQDTMTSRLPKFSLQPLVENMFEHGLQRKEGTWHLTVRMKRIGNRTAVMIGDDGVGMPEERLSQLRSELRSGMTESERGNELGTGPGPKKRRGIGLRNVNARLRLHFGANYGLRLFSKPNGGTMIVMTIPAQHEEGASAGGLQRTHN